MNNKKRILHITTVNTMGGAEKKVINILKTEKKDFDYTVTSIRDLKGPLGEWVRQLNYKYIDLNQKTTIHKIYHLSKILKTNKFDLVQSYGLTAEVFGCCMARIFSIPCVSTLVSTNDYNTCLRKIIGRISSKFVSQFVSVSQSGADILYKLIHVPHHKINVIINGIEIINQKNYDSKKVRNKYFKILTVANLHPRKGHKYLLLAIKSIYEQGYDDMEFIFAGRDDYQGKLHSFAESLGVRDKVHFAGFQNDIYPLLYACDLFLLPSCIEGIPISIIEAMSFGKPVIATNVGGIPEIIKNNGTGLLIPACDPKAISEAILKLYYSKEKRNYLAKNAKVYSHKFLNKDRMVQEYWDIYYKLCSQ